MIGAGRDGVARWLAAAMVERSGRWIDPKQWPVAVGAPPKR